MGHENCKSLCKKWKRYLNETLPQNNNSSSNPAQTAKPYDTSSRVKENNKPIKLSSILYFNSGSIINKRDFLDIILKCDKYGMVFITETWLKSCYPDSFIVDTNEYSLIRGDRQSGKRGGGICVIYKNSFASKITTPYINLDRCIGFEILAFDIHVNKFKYYRFLLVYLPPDSAKNVETMTTLLDTIQNLNVTKDFYVLGDFNLSKINWKKLASSTLNQPSQIFKDYLDEHNLTQLITFPTHKHGSTLDLFFTSKPENVIDIIKCAPFTTSCDHNMIEFQLDLNYSKKSESPPPMRNFNRCDFNQINKYLSSWDWDALFHNINDVNTMYEKFISVLQKSIEKFVPLYKKNKKRTLPKRIKTLIKQKKSLYKKAKTDNTAKLQYKELEKTYKKAIKKYKTDLENNILKYRNKKAFYGYIKKKLHTKSHLPPLVTEDKEIVMESFEKAELFNSYFSSVFSKDNGNLPNDIPYGDTDFLSNMDPLTITPTHIKNAIRNLKSSVSRSPDNIPSIFIKNTSSTLIKPLTKLFNLFLLKGKIPEIWRTALVIPIHKTGLKSTVSNYRPISLTSVFCRLFESIVHNHLITHLTNNKILSDTQHGFLRKKSTLTQHIDLLDKLTTNYDNKITSEMIYLDFSKAFDSVSHRKLIHILHHLQLNNSTLSWIIDYLSNRSQRTIVNGTFSNSTPVISGVPQGSVLGPLLFLLYLGVLLKILEKMDNITVYAYADDLKILGTNCNSIQIALNKIENWSAEWQLNINCNKSEHITFSRTSSTKPDFFFNNLTIPKTDIVKDLGILISHDLKWKNQISKVYSKSISLIYLILRSFKSNNPAFYINLYNLYVRPILEYNCTAWSPYLISDIKRIESIQAKFTKRLCQNHNIKFTNYKHRLEILKLDSLEIRRTKINLIFIYKMLHNLVDLNFNKFFTLNNYSNKHNLRRHQFQIYQPKHPNSIVRSQFFSYKIIAIWNQLPDELVSASSLILFKSKLDKINLDNIITYH